MDNSTNITEKRTAHETLAQLIDSCPHLTMPPRGVPARMAKVFALLTPHAPILTNTVAKKTGLTPTQVAGTMYTLRKMGVVESAPTTGADGARKSMYTHTRVYDDGRNGKGELLVNKVRAKARRAKSSDSPSETLMQLQSIMVSLHETQCRIDRIGKAMVELEKRIRRRENKRMREVKIALDEALHDLIKDA